MPMLGSVWLLAYKREVVPNTEGENGSEGIEGRVGKIVVLLSWEPVANTVLPPGPVSLFSPLAFLGSPQDRHSFDACGFCLLKSPLYEISCYPPQHPHFESMKVCPC